MWGADEFGPGFQRTLVRACVDDAGLRELVRRFTDAGQLGFTDPASAWAWKVVADTHRPTLLVLDTEARRLSPTDPSAVGVRDILSAGDVREHEYVSNQIIEWARRQTFAAGFEESRQAWNAGDFEKAREVMLQRITEMESFRLETADRGWFFEELEGRQERRAFVAAGLDYFPTGIQKLDERMRGGLSYEELGIAVAYSKIGKSFWLNQMGFICARMRRRCLHFVLEGGRSKCEDRYEARWMHSFYGDVRKGNIDADAFSRARREYAILKKGLVVRGHADKEEWRITPNDIVSELTILREQHGWVPDMIIIDYGDLVWSPGDSETARQKASFRMMKSLASRREHRGHRGYAIWTASQAVRPGKGADTKEHVVKPRDIADCYEKVRCADAILSLNITVDERAVNRGRVYLGDYRDNEANLIVRVETDYDHGAFSKLNAPEPPPLKKAA